MMTTDPLSLGDAIDAEVAQAVSAMRERAEKSEAAAAELRAALTGLCRQVEIGTFFDEHGHDAKMLQPYYVAQNILASPTAGSGPRRL